MADFKDALPGFKKKRIGIASTIRNYFAKMLKPAAYPIQEFSLVNKIPQATAEHARNEMPSPSLADNYKPTKAPEMASFATDALDEVRKANAPKSSLGLQVKIPKPEKKKVGIKVTADGPSIARAEGVDKGLTMVDPDSFSNPNIKKMTVVDKEFQVSLRYRMPTKLRNVPKKDLHTLSQWLTDQIRQIEVERSDFVGRLLKYRAMWLDFVSTGLTAAFEGAHDIHVPVVFEKIKAMHSRIYQAILGIDPPFSLKPRDKVTETQKYEKEQLLNYIIKDYANLGRGWEEVVDRDIWNYVADGTSITKQDWLRDVRKYSDVKDEFQGFKNGEPQYTEIEEEVEKVIYDGPMFKTVPLEDFYIAGANVNSPDEADLCAERVFYTKSDLIKLAQQDFFYKDTIDKVLSTEPINQNQVASLDYTTFKQQERELAGVDRETTGHKVYEIFEAYCRWDIDHDGVDEELVVWYEKSSGLILRMTYLERSAPGAIRPFTIKRFINRPNSPFGIGMAEMMYGLNNAQDYIVNQRLDYGTLQNLPFGFIRAASGTKPTPIRLAPGTMYPLDDPQNDVNFPRLSGGTSYGFQEENAIVGYGDKLSGITGFNMGSTDTQGATRTATGTAALVAEVNTNLDIHIKRYQRGYKRNLYILDKQIQQLLPLGTVIRMLGMDGKEILMQFENREAIAFSSDFELTANSVSSNKAIERDTANMLLQVMQNPLALQAGLVTPQNLYNVYRNLLQKSEIKDIDAYITKPDQSSDSPYSAKDELTMILGGIKPPIYMKDRHQEKLMFFQQFEQSDDFGWYGPEQVELYRATKKAHEDMLNALNAQLPIAGNNTSGQMQSMMAAQMGAGGGVPQGQPAQQMSDLAPQSSPTQK